MTQTKIHAEKNNTIHVDLMGMSSSSSLASLSSENLQSIVWLNKSTSNNEKKNKNKATPNKDKKNTNRITPNKEKKNITQTPNCKENTKDWINKSTTNMVNKITTQPRIEADKSNMTQHEGINKKNEPKSTNTEVTTTEDKRLKLTTEDGKLNLECQNYESITPHAHRILTRKHITSKSQMYTLYKPLSKTQRKQI